jgi:predicted hydrocarbon binding protein
MTERQQAFHDLAPRVVDLDVSNNGLVSYAGRRLVFFHTDMIAELFKNLEDLAGPIMQRKIKEFGAGAGHTMASKLDAEFRDSSKFEDLQLILDPPELDKLRSIEDTSNLGQIEKILGLSTYDGWVGDVDIEDYEDGKQATFIVTNSFEAASHGQTGEKQCRFFTGVIEGILEYFWDTDVTAEETSCACEGDDTCRIEATAENA